MGKSAHSVSTTASLGCIVLQELQYERIRIELGGDDEPPRSIIHRKTLILALCLRADLNPRFSCSPAEVWWEADDYFAEEWGEVLAWDTGAMRLYISHGPDRGFKDQGIYSVMGSTQDKQELAWRMAFPGIQPLSRIIFLDGPLEGSFNSGRP